MKTKAILFTLLAFWLFTAGSCNDDDGETKQIPPVTQVGNNTFYVKIGDKIYTPKSSKTEVYYPQYNGVYLIDELNYIDCMVWLSSQKFDPIGFLINTNTQKVTVGEYIINDQYGQKGSVYLEYLEHSNTKNYIKYRGKKDAGKITILRNDDEVLSGFIEGVLYTPNKEDIKFYAQFDLNKNTINDKKFPL